MQLKSQVKLINDCQAISNAASRTGPRNTLIIIIYIAIFRRYFIAAMDLAEIRLF
jgi:hypothetical protein